MEGIMKPATSGRKIHPHKFAMWLGMGSIAMMFAGLTSAYVVRQGQGNWRYYDLPITFWISTIIIFASSITYSLGLKSFKQRKIPAFRILMIATLILGATFGILQYYGFYQLYHTPQVYHMNGITDTINMTPVTVPGNPSESFLFIIAGLHLLHIAGGIVALMIVFIRNLNPRIKIYNATGLEIVGHYWHFVDILWIYLFIFFIVNQ